MRNVVLFPGTNQFLLFLLLRFLFFYLLDETYYGFCFCSITNINLHFLIFLFFFTFSNAILSPVRLLCHGAVQFTVFLCCSVSLSIHPVPIIITRLFPPCPPSPSQLQVGLLMCSVHAHSRIIYSTTTPSNCHIENFAFIPISPKLLLPAYPIPNPFVYIAVVRTYVHDTPTPHPLYTLVLSHVRPDGVHAYTNSGPTHRLCAFHLFHPFLSSFHFSCVHSFSFPPLLLHTLSLNQVDKEMRCIRYIQEKQMCTGIILSFFPYVCPLEWHESA